MASDTHPPDRDEQLVRTYTPRPLELDRVQSSRSAAGEIRLRLSGRWVDRRTRPASDEELLVVNLEGRRHRFAAEPDDEAQTTAGA